MEEKKLNELFSIICELFNAEPKEVRKRSRKELYVHIRQLFMYYCDNYTSYSHREVGYFLGLDRTTVLHGVQTIKDLLDVSQNTIKEMELIKNKFNITQNNIRTHKIYLGWCKQKIKEQKKIINQQQLEILELKRQIKLKEALYI